MSRAIWKFQFVNGKLVQMPVGAVIKHFGLDPAGVRCFWAECDPDAPTEDRLFTIQGTGHLAVSGDAVHVATFNDGPFMWHVYEVQVA